MLDFHSQQNRIVLVDREDRALQRCNPSARSMPEDGQEHMPHCMLLPSCPSFGCKAINLPSWCEAPTKVKQTRTGYRSDICQYSMNSVSDIGRVPSFITGSIRRITQGTRSWAGMRWCERAWTVVAAYASTPYPKLITDKM